MLQQADKMCCREFVTAQVAFHQNYHDHHYGYFDYHHQHYDHQDYYFDDGYDHDDSQDVKNGHQRLNLAFTANLFNKY